VVHVEWRKTNLARHGHAWQDSRVEVPSQSIVDIQTSQEERPGASGPRTGYRTVLATVVAVDTLTNRVKVQTQAGQVIELDTLPKTTDWGTGHAHCPR